MGRLLDALTFGPARRRRSMNKQLAQWTEAYRTGAPLGGPRGGGFDARPSFGLGSYSGGGYRGSGNGSPGPGLGRLVLVLGVIVALVVGAIIAARSLTDGRPSSPAESARSGSTATAPSSSDTQGQDRDQPPPGIEESPTRLLPVVIPPPGSGGYTFEGKRPDGAPVTYDPCRPIHYVVRPTNAPPNGSEIVQQSIAAVSAATGLRFVYDGTTDEGPSDKRSRFQPERYGNRWAPVLITWSTPRESPALGGRTLGYGGSQWLTRTLSSSEGTSVFAANVTGQVTLDGPQLGETEAQAGQQAVRGVVEHELAHVVGLGHVNDQRELMYPETDLKVFDYQAADRRGLALLGDGPCTPEL